MLLNPPASHSKWPAALKRTGSENRGPISCRPTGRPLPSNPHGTEIAGTTAMFTVTVQPSAAYISSGSPMFSPSRKAVNGEVGVAIRSQPENASSNSWESCF